MTEFYKHTPRYLEIFTEKNPNLNDIYFRNFFNPGISLEIQIGRQTMKDAYADHAMWVRNIEVSEDYEP